MPLRRAIEHVTACVGSEEAAADKIVARLRSGELVSRARFISISPKEGSRYCISAEQGLFLLWWPWEATDQDLPRRFWEQARIDCEGEALSAVATSDIPMWRGFDGPLGALPEGPIRHEATGIVVLSDDLLALWPDEPKGEAEPTPEAIEPAKKGPGRPAGSGMKADWPALLESFMAECKQRGAPIETNVKCWSQHKDVVEWMLQQRIEPGRTLNDLVVAEEVTMRTVNGHARKFRAQARNAFS